MRNLEHARARAKEVRDEIGLDTEGLLERVEAYLFREYMRYLTPLPGPAMQGSRGEVSLGSPLLRYDEKLDRTPEQKIVIVAHELGHLDLHKRLSDPNVPADPLLGSAYMGSGAPGVARYSEKAKEEAQANAFAAEFLCPAAEALRDWLEGSSPEAISGRRGIPVELVHAQLAEALYERGSAGEAESPTAPQREPTVAQANVARETGSPVLVVAGPGTGKTGTLVRRIEHLLEEQGARPEQLLVLTFSVEAAEELRTRVAQRFGTEVADAMEISTFHGWGYVFLHHFAQEAGRRGELTLLDEPAQAELVAEVMATVDCDAILDLRDPNDTAKKAARLIAYLKDRLVGPEHLESALREWVPGPGEPDTRAEAGALLALYRAYETEKERRSAVDFGDLIMLPRRILADNPEVKARLANKHPWVMVDEYQDVSRAVAELLMQLCGPDNPPWAVADKRQAIYRFRGAHPDNVDAFATDFPGAKLHALDVNFRSGKAIVEAANHLASLLASPDHEGPPPELWTAARDLPSAAPPAVVIAEANSDTAEREGIANQVSTWVNAGVEKADIAVLARRNIDVRQISLALNRLGIRAVTSGIATSEGAAGDLTAVAALLDAPRAALPRLVYALFRGILPAATLNEAIESLLATMGQDGSIDAAPIPGAQGVAERIAALQARMAPLRFSADGWEILCAFLFGDGEYLRDLLRRVDDVGAALALEEIVSVLSVAAAHRYAHSGAKPWRSRVGFSDRLRLMLSKATPLLTPPPARPDAVRVMTCHASKGLEFPYVVVAGQTLSAQGTEQPWLPPALRANHEDDARQADSLLFVGVTRAQRAVVVSHARSAGGTTLARYQRERPLLHARWSEQADLPRVSWESERSEQESFRGQGLWGGAYPDVIPAYLLTGGGCAIRTYLQRTLHAEFPTATQSLWPAYVGITRRAMQRVIREANASGGVVDHVRAQAVLDEEWGDAAERDHLLLPLYRRHAERRLARLADAYMPDAAVAEDLASEVKIEVDEQARLVRTDLLAYFRLADGRRRAIGLEADSLAAKLRPDGELNWTELRKGALQWPFALLETQGDGALELFVYSDADGRLYRARWSRTKASTGNARDTAHEQVLRGVARRIEARIVPFICGGCAHRVHCPHWLGAGTGAT